MRPKSVAEPSGRIALEQIADMGCATCHRPPQAPPSGLRLPAIPGGGAKQRAINR